MAIALLVITDGRADTLTRAIESAQQNLSGDVTERWMYDDSGDDEHRAWLRERFPEFRVFDAGPRQGFGGAIRAAWTRLLNASLAGSVFHCEDDFLFNRPVDLDAMDEVVRTFPHLAQMCLRRQPWNAEERAAGGVVEVHPDDYWDCWMGDYWWLEHRLFWTTNPGLYRREVMEAGWPTGEHSEGRFTHQLLHQGYDIIPGDEIRFGYWGLRQDAPWVHHIGHERVGVGY